MGDEQDVKEFWRELEDEVGEKIQWYSLGELLSPFDGLQKNSVGMFFLTDSCLYFQTFPQNDFFRILANSFRRKKKDGERIQRGYPRDEMLSVDIVRPRGFLGKLGGGGMPVVSIEFQKKESGVKMSMRFTLLDRKAGDELVERLKADA